MLYAISLGNTSTAYSYFHDSIVLSKCGKIDGLQYKPVKVGDGKTPAIGDRVVVDWEGYVSFF